MKWSQSLQLSNIAIQDTCILDLWSCQHCFCGLTENRLIVPGANGSIYSGCVAPFWCQVMLHRMEKGWRYCILLCTIPPLLAAAQLLFLNISSRRFTPRFAQILSVFDQKPPERNESQPATSVHERVDYMGCIFVFAALFGIFFALQLDQWPLSTAFLVPGIVLCFVSIASHVPTWRYRFKLKSPPIIPSELNSSLLQ